VLARTSGARVFATPFARRIAIETGVDLALVKGTGPQGRIVKADVASVRAVAHRDPASVRPPPPLVAQAAPPPSGPTAESLPRGVAERPFAEIALDGMRRTIAARLTEAKQKIPHFYLRRDIGLDALLDVRGKINAAIESSEEKLSVNDFIIKAAALALRRTPACNAIWAGDRILRFEVVDVAVAVAIDGGLFTPVIRDADTKSLTVIASEMKCLADRAKSKKLAPHEYQGGAFAISNLGMMGIDSFDAVINPPHASILAVGAGVRKPVVKGDAIVAATVMSVTLSVDHRVIDGVLGARFLAELARFIESPLSILV
jgi:pyruvate dehydrogenase E2 component (dihydrolipoamide acetyltransferase)